MSKYQYPTLRRLVLYGVYTLFIDNRLEELQEKYNQEFEERRRLETELKVLQVKVSYITFIAHCSSLQVIKLSCCSC